MLFPTTIFKNGRPSLFQRFRSSQASDFRIIGGQAWPWKTVNQIGPSYGFEPTEGYLPNWRGSSTNINNDDFTK